MNLANKSSYSEHISNNFESCILKIKQNINGFSIFPGSAAILTRVVHPCVGNLNWANHLMPLNPYVCVRKDVDGILKRPRLADFDGGCKNFNTI